MGLRNSGYALTCWDTILKIFPDVNGSVQEERVDRLAEVNDARQGPDGIAFAVTFGWEGRPGARSGQLGAPGREGISELWRRLG